MRIQIDSVSPLSNDERKNLEKLLEENNIKIKKDVDFFYIDLKSLDQFLNVVHIINEIETNDSLIGETYTSNGCDLLLTIYNNYIE